MSVALRDAKQVHVYANVPGHETARSERRHHVRVEPALDVRLRVRAVVKCIPAVKGNVDPQLVRGA